jgi:hypothetical protein
VVSFTPRPLYPPVPPRIEGWVGHRAGLDAVVKRKIPMRNKQNVVGILGMIICKESQERRLKSKIPRNNQYIFSTLIIIRV